jgi:ubiquinone biosynthesis protein
LHEIPIPDVIRDINYLLKQYDLHMPSDIAMFNKTCITLEGFGRQIYPDFNLTQEARPLVEQSIKNKLKPSNLVKASFNTVSKGIDRLYNHKHFSSTPETNPFTPGSLEKIDIDRMVSRIERAIYRLVQGGLLASLFIGSAIIATLPDGPQVLGMHVLGLIGFFCVAFSSSWLLFLLWWTMRGRD